MAEARRRAWARISKRTWVVLGAAGALVIAGGVTAIILLGTRADTAEAGAEAATRTAEASLETFTTSLEATGTLTPAVQESVAFEASGTVQTVDVEAGDTVTAGQQLATIDTLTVDAELLQAQADLADAAASLASAQESSDGSTSAVARISALDAEVALAQTAVEEAEAATAATTLTAPVAGLVTDVTIEAGDTVSSGSGSSAASGSSSGSTSGSSSTPGGASGTGGTTSSTDDSTTSSAVTIVGTDSWQVDVSLGETEIDQVEVGDTVELVTDDDVSLDGTVSEVGKLPSTTSGTASYTVSITAQTDEETTGIYDGTSVTATIITDSREDVLSVPSAAVTTTPEGGSTVTVVDSEDGDDSGTEREVTVGETSGDLVEILDGLEAGEQVLVTTFAGGGQQGGQTGESDEQMPGGGEFPGGGELPSGGEMPGGGEMPSGGQGGFPGGGQQ